VVSPSPSDHRLFMGELHMKSLAPTNPHWARVVGYGPFSLCVIYKKGLYPSSGGINRLMMMMIKTTTVKRLKQFLTYSVSLRDDKIQTLNS
jgi:hypothetical protein